MSSLLPSVQLAIDAVGAKHSGAATVLRAVVASAIHHGKISRIVVFCSPRSMRDFDLPSNPRLEVVDVAAGEGGLLRRVRWLLRGLPRQIEEHGSDVALLMSGAGTVPPGTRSVLFIQQSLPFSREAVARLSLLDQVRIVALRWLMRRSSAAADALVVQTRTMKEAAVRALDVDPGKVHVVAPSATLQMEYENDHAALALIRQTAENARVLYIGNTSAYKNLEVLAATVPIMRRSRPEMRLFATVPRHHPLARVEGVTALGRLASGVLPAAYRLATVLVMPSLVETVGLPMLEAMSCGTPVVAADRPYAREVCGDAGQFFDPASPADLAEKLLAVSSDAHLRRRMAEAGLKIAQQRAQADPYKKLIDVAVGVCSAAALPRH